ncbi:putative aspartyl protease [Ophiocordyceps camponoti-leonardi (nom. inval.)]|nr:putative aspartyl protease [Ophiocordyceps camponoti-leonardi (nom. inval.)]
MWHLSRFVSFFSLLVVAFASVSARTTPFDFRTRSARSFSVEVQERDNYRRDFVNDWAAAHRKWGSGVPNEALDAFSLADGESQIQVMPLIHDQIYVANIDIGTPPQRVKMALDTGSSDVWVQSTDTKYRVNTDGPWPPKYSPNASTTAHQVDKAMWNIRYADESNAVGVVYRDTVRLGNLEVRNATVQSAAIMSATFERETGFSGIMGLAKRLHNNIEPPQPTFLSMLRRQLRKPVFAVDLRRNASSRFDFGHVDASLASDGMTWVPTNASSPHWAVEFDLTAWTGKDSVWLYHQFEAIIDTGTSLMFLPERLVARYWAAVPGMKASLRLQGSYRFPCGVEDKLPDLLFKLPGTEHVLTVPGRYLNYGPTLDDPEVCWGGLQSASQLDGSSILGDIFLKAMFVAFDMETGRVGFANKELHDK